MPARKPAAPGTKPQSERFIEMARELGCEADEAVFKERVEQILRTKPRPAKAPVRIKRPAR